MSFLRWVLRVFPLLLALNGAFSENAENSKGKVLSIFNVITFPNIACVGASTQNGTCYTSAECNERGGEPSGNCADGYGVCCIITLSCGGSSSDNSTYLEQISFSTKSALGENNPCTYKICKNNEDICRIRLDFINFSLDTPVSDTVVTIANAANAIETTGGALGDCTVDSFTYSSPGNQGSPVICGPNSGQHMILDASDFCNFANFNIGNSAVSRSWTILATQFECGDPNGGPSDCLQYFSESTGAFSSFGYDNSAVAVSLTAQHLSNQCYSICFRRSSGMCSICFSPAIDSPALDNPSFGLSMSSVANKVKSAFDTECNTDYLFIHNGVKKGAVQVTDGNQKFCGPIFAQAASATSTTICTFTTPFRVTFKSDNNEITDDNTDAKKSELVGPPGGTIGFRLFFNQVMC